MAGGSPCRRGRDRGSQLRAPGVAGAAWPLDRSRDRRYGPSGRDPTGLPCKVSGWMLWVDTVETTDVEIAPSLTLRVPIGTRSVSEGLPRGELPANPIVTT